LSGHVIPSSGIFGLTSEQTRCGWHGPDVVDQWTKPNWGLRHPLARSLSLSPDFGEKFFRGLADNAAE